MEASEPTKPRFGPNWPYVDVKKALADEAAFLRVRGAVRALAESPVFALVVRQVRAEQGVWLREGRTWPEPIQRAADNAFATALLLSQLVQECTWLDAPVHDTSEKMRQALRDRWLAVLQAMLDRVVERARDSEMDVAPVLAGIAGRCDGLEALDASSGVHAAYTLGWCLRRCVLHDVANPFAPYLVSVAQRHAMRRQVDRNRPRSSGDLQPDDVAILRACALGPLPAKQVAARCMVEGRQLSASHVEKRKGDLRKWGLLRRARTFELSTTGREWLRELDDAARA